MNMSLENKAHFQAEKEAIHLILTGIGDEIYSTVDACQTAQEMWEAIERLQQGESLNIQDVKTNLFWEFGKFTSHDGETMESYYTGFYKLMNEMIRNNLIVATMQVNVQFLQQLQPEWSWFVTIVKQQHKLDEVSYHKLFDILKQYQKEVNELCAERLAMNANPLALVATAQANQDPYYQTSKSHKSHAPSSKPSIPTRSHTTTRHKGKEIAKRITPPSETASEEDSDPEQAQRDKDMQKNLALIAKQFGNQRTVNVAGARENVGSPVVQQSEIQCFNCKEFGHFAKECRKPKRVKDFAYHKEKMLLCKQAEQGTDSEPLEQVQNEAGYNVFANDLQHSEQSESNEQNDVESDDERVALANLTANLKLNECKTILAETSKSLGESISVRDSCLVALQTKQTEFEKYKAFNDRTIDYDKLEHQFRAPTAQDMEILIQTCLMPLAIKTQNDSFLFVYELKQEMHADLKYVESLKKEIDELEFDKAEFSNMYDMILQECVSKDVIKTFDLEIALQKRKEQVKHDTVWNEKASNVFRKECEQYIEIQDLKAQLQDKNIAISELKKLIEKGKEKSVDIKFDKPSVVRQPNAQRIPKPSVLGKPTPFSNSLERIYFSKTKSVPKTNVSEGLSKPVTAQTLPHTARQAVSNTNVLKPGMYQINNRSTQTRAPQVPQTVRNTNPRVSTSTGVNHTTNVSRPQHKSNQLKDKVVTNNSQVKLKKTQVEVHHRIPSVSNKMKSVTVCNDSLNSRTSNANAVCATCNKCFVDSNHFACVTKMLNDVNARTKKPNIVQLILFIVDSGCTEHMTGNLKLLCNFVEKFLGTVRFGNDQLYGDLGNDLLTGNRGSDLYIISLQESTSSTPLCLMAKASPTQAWLWHRRLSHLNFDYINLLSKKDNVIGLTKLKYVKDHLCSFCELSKAKRSSFKSKAVPSLKGRQNLLHMDLCGPMRVASINGKKYIMVIVDDYSRYTWPLFLRSKDETPEVLKEFLTTIQRNLQASVITVRTDRGTEFLNKTLNAFLKKKELSIKLSLLEHLNRTALSKDETALWLRLLERCSQLQDFLYSSGLKQLQPHALLKTDP
nr:hypothetical protein [Tanacetum cinerariifolium]